VVVELGVDERRLVVAALQTAQQRRAGPCIQLAELLERRHRRGKRSGRQQLLVLGTLVSARVPIPKPQQDEQQSHRQERLSRCIHHRLANTGMPPRQGTDSGRRAAAVCPRPARRIPASYGTTGPSPAANLGCAAAGATLQPYETP